MVALKSGGGAVTAESAMPMLMMRLFIVVSFRFVPMAGRAGAHSPALFVRGACLSEPAALCAVGAKSGMDGCRDRQCLAAPGTPARCHRICHPKCPCLLGVRTNQHIHRCPHPVRDGLRLPEPLLLPVNAAKVGVHALVVGPTQV